jgi:thiol:disulfide interchange protein DsbC
VARNRFLLFVVGLLASSLALGDEAAIRRALEPKIGSARIEGIQRTPIEGLFEVHIRSEEGFEILYVDRTGTHVIQTDGRNAGHIIDIVNGRNVTDERLRKLTAIKFESLPLDLAIKVQRGNGKRVLAMFSDPYCPACRQFERVLAQMDNIAIYVFMYPVIRPENADHSRRVWCAPDRAKAWLELASGSQAKIPAAPMGCGDPVDKILSFGQNLGVRSTPTLIFANGERVAGGLSPADLQRQLDRAR